MWLPLHPHARPYIYIKSSKAHEAPISSPYIKSSKAHKAPISSPYIYIKSSKAHEAPKSQA